MFRRRNKKPLEQLIYEKLFQTSKNHKNSIVWYDGSVRHKRSFFEFWDDVAAAMAALDQLSVRKIGILGPTSYNWMVLDLACMMTGCQSIAFPESLSSIQLNSLFERNPVSALFCDSGYEGKLANYAGKIILFTASSPIRPTGSTGGKYSIGSCRIRKDYSVVFSSGSTGLPKAIPLVLKQGTFKRQTSSAINRRFDKFVGNRAQIWKRKGNKFIIFMPFSHYQQRHFAWRCLMMRCNILLSDPRTCLSHIICEKPNIIVSVPLIFDVLANLIEKELRGFSPRRLKLLNFLNSRGFGQLERSNPLRILYDRFVIGSSVRNIYGGKADVFISGSAPINKNTLEILSRVGVNVYDIYSQTELGIIAANTPGRCRIGTVGLPFQDLKIAEDGEIMVRFDENMHDASLLTIDSFGYAHTGDIGSIDEDGYLRYVGRKNSVIVLRNGKKIQPESVEAAFREIPDVDAAIILSLPVEGLALVLIVSDSTSAEGIRERVLSKSSNLAEHEKPLVAGIYRRSECSSESLWTTSGKTVRNAIESYVLANPRFARLHDPIVGQ